VNVGNGEKQLYDVIVSSGLDRTLPSAKQFVMDYSSILSARTHRSVQTARNLQNRIPTLATEIDKATKPCQVPNLNQQLTDLYQKYPMLLLLAGLTGASYYGNDRTELLKKNSKTVLDYITLIG
jgi:hypothetical protein